MSFDPVSPERHHLDNGLTILLKQQHGSPVVAMQAWVGVGSADEPDEIAGISHVFEHMLFKGTARRGVGVIAHEVEAAGGEINAWTSFDQTVYHLVLASRYFESGIDILTDALRNSSFDEGELARELKVVLEEVKQGEDNPSRVATQSLFSTAYRRHPYRRPVIGHTEVLERLGRKDLLAVFRRYYVPNNITLVLVGDFDPARARRRISAAWKGARRRALPPAVRPVEPQQRRTRIVLDGGEVSEIHVVGGFHIPAMRHPDTAALDLAAILLGQGDSSRLQSDLKRSRQLVSEAWAYSFTPRDPGLLVLGATLPPERLDDAPAALFAEAFRLAGQEATREEVEKARAIVESDAIYQKETVQGMARKLGFFETVTGSVGFEEEYLAQVREVTPSSLREAVARHLRPENLTLSMMMPSRSEALASTERRQAVEARLRDVVGSAARSAVVAPRRGEPRPDPRREVVREKLPSGVQVLVLRDPSVPLVAMRAAWTGGLREETEQDNGVNNLLAALLTRGTTSRTGDRIAREVEALAGSIGGFSGRNSLGLRAEVMARHVEHGLTMVADCLTDPLFVDGELEREKRQIIEEIRTQEDNVTSVAFRMFGRALWPTHPYRLDLAGSAQSMEALTRERVLAYYRDHYHPSRMALAVVGDVEPGVVIEHASRLFPPTACPPQTVAKVHRVDAPPASPIRVRRQLNKQQAHLVLGFAGTTLRDPDRVPLEVLATILSGQGGRLFVELREKHGLAYRVNAFTLEGLDPGYFAVYVACSPDKLAVAEEQILVELRKVVERPVGRQELSRAQRYLAGSHDISLQRRASLAATLAFNECYGLGWDQYLRYAPSVMAVTPDELQRVAARYLDFDRSITAVVSPDEEVVGASPLPPEEIAEAARAATGAPPKH